MGRVLAGGFVGGILMFLWGFLSHSKLQLVEKELLELPRESAVVGTIRDNVKEPGIYRFPWVDMESLSDDAASKAFEEKLKTGPVGIIVRMPDGLPLMDPMQLAWEFASNVAAALIAAVVVSAIGGSRSAPSKVVIVTLLGTFAWLSQDASNWIWYHYPSRFEVAMLVDAVAGWFIAGVGIVAVVRTKVAAR